MEEHCLAVRLSSSAVGAIMSDLASASSLTVSSTPGGTATSDSAAAAFASRFGVGPGTHCVYYGFNNCRDVILSQTLLPAVLGSARVGGAVGSFSLSSGSWHYRNFLDYSIN